MIGTLLGLGTGIIGSIIGGSQASAAAKKAEAELAKQRQSNQAWYDRRYNEDYTQTAEAQNLLTKAREAAKEQIQAAVGRQAVMGGTEEGVSAARQDANSMLSNTLSDVAAQGTARKDAIEKQYMETERNISNQYMNMYNQRAANSTAAANGAMQAGMGLVGADLSSKLLTGKGLFGADLSSKLLTGKGLFGDAFKKKSAAVVTPQLGKTILPDYTKINDPYANLFA